MSSPTLLGAVYSRFQSDVALAAAVPGSPYLDEVPETVDLPFVIVEHGGEEPDKFTFERRFTENGSFTLKAYAQGEAAAEAIGTLIKAAFDEVALDVTDTNGIRLRRTGYTVRLDRMRSSQTKRVTEVEIPYVAWTQKDVGT